MSARLDFDPIEEARRQWASRWSGAAGTMAAATALIRAQQIVLRTVDEALRPCGLTFARYEVLALLSFTRRGELPLGKMGPRLMIHPTSVTNAVDRLEAQGLVERVPHPSDRRTTLARITERGRALVGEATTSVNASAFGLGALDDGQLDGLSDILRVLRRSAGDFDDDGRSSS